METKTKVVIVGKIENVGEVQTFSGGFRKCEVVVRDKFGSEKWPSFYPCIFKKENIAKLNGWKAGDEVCIEAYVNGNRWIKKDANGKPVQAPRYFLELDAFSICADDGKTEEPEQIEEPPAEEVSADDMPF